MEEYLFFFAGSSLNILLNVASWVLVQRFDMSRGAYEEQNIIVNPGGRSTVGVDKDGASVVRLAQLCCGQPDSTSSQPVSSSASYRLQEQLDRYLESHVRSCSIPKHLETLLQLYILIYYKHSSKCVYLHIIYSGLPNY